MMHSPIKTKKSDSFGRYYTQAIVARLLVESMHMKSPKTVIDLGAGGGSLVGEACKHWNNTSFITVDIDKSAGSINLPTLHGQTFTHHVTDALNSKLNTELGINLGEIDCGLCNPPYIKPQWRASFGEILESAGLTQALPQIGNIPADILFIAQNLRLISSGGKLGLILSDGLIAGEKYAKLRNILACTHRIERVIELPRNIFQKTDAKAHILILCKDSESSQNIQIQKLEKNGTLSRSIEIPAESAKQRLDYSYLINTKKRKKTSSKTLRDLGVTIKRGGFSSSEINRVNFPVFHTTNFIKGMYEIPDNFILSPLQHKLVTKFISNPGDILIARIGRNLTQKICQIKTGHVAISDCIFSIRAPEEYQKIIFEYLSSNEGKAQLESLSHGVGANFITTESILSIQI